MKTAKLILATLVVLMGLFYTGCTVKVNDPEVTIVETTTPITTDGTVLSAQISPAGNIDWYSFSAVAGTKYFINTGNGDVDIVLFLYSTDKATKLDSTDQGASTENLTFTCAVSGTYYAKVRGYSSSYTGTYDIWITAETVVPMTTDSTIVAASISAASESDWYSFDAVSGLSYQINAGNGNVDLIMSLYDTDKTTLLASKDAVLSSGTETYTFNCTVTGKYYVKTRAYGGTATGSYNVWIHPPVATSITADSTIVAQQIAVAGEWNWYSFYAVNGGTYTIKVGDGDVDLVVTLFSKDRATVLDTKDLAGSTGTETLTLNCTSSGRYYIKAKAFASTSTGSFNIWIY